MRNATTENPIRELDRRNSDGIDVRLLWKSGSEEVVVAVHDARTGESFELQVAPGDAVFAFHHPYAYETVPGTPTHSSHEREYGN